MASTPMHRIALSFSFVLALVSALLVVNPASAQRASAPPAEPLEAEFTAALLAASQAADCEALEGLLDVRGAVDRAFEGIRLHPDERAAMVASFRDAMVAPNTGMLSLMCAPRAVARVASRGSMTVAGRRLVRFSVYPRAGGVTILGFDVVRSADGRARAVDVYQAMVGSFVSDEIVMNAFSQSSLDTQLERTTGARGRLLAAHRATLRACIEASAAGDVARVEAAFATLPPLLRDDISLGRLRILAAQRSGDLVAYRRILDEVVRAHPDAVQAAALSMDDAVLRGDFRALLSFVDRTEQLVGADPYFDFLRAIGHGNLRNVPEALTMALRAARADRDCDPAWGLAMNLASALGREAEALEAYRELVRLGALPASFATDPVYATVRDALARESGRRR